MLKSASSRLSNTGGPIVYREGDYAEAMADKRWGGDADIEAQARRNLELLGGLGGGEES